MNSRRAASVLVGIRRRPAGRADIADRPFEQRPASSGAPPIEAFLAGLRMAWKDGEVRPTARPKLKQKRGRRRPDPLAKVTAAARKVHGRALAHKPSVA
jgi:hypothetical protein